MKLVHTSEGTKCVSIIKLIQWKLSRQTKSVSCKNNGDGIKHCAGKI
jgi:hypothetical protein